MLGVTVVIALFSLWLINRELIEQGIAKGKLSAELNYKIEDRKLTATNQIFLDQLTFGDKVDSPDACTAARQACPRAAASVSHSGAQRHP